MGLDAGARLGPYEIVGPLGAGGMGDVYEGRDTRLNRRVAIKIIKGQFSDRFEREARAISALNHPHICTLHDMGTVDGLQYLVMEFIEGEPLSHQLRRGPLPLHDALRIASGIAAALDAAHRKGIVHRDLKPGNIMLTRTGAKLLDFGLARTAIIGDRVDAMSTVTAAVDLTAPGAVLGTPQYMAPEQLEGKVADHRTDIFAFGAVLFEILTGQKAFSGASAVGVMAAILRAESRAITDVRPELPVQLNRLVKTCLAKDPDERWQNARDLLHELSWISAGDNPARAPSQKVHPALTLGLAVALGVSLAYVSFLLFFRPRAPALSLFRFSIAAPENVNFSLPVASAAAPQLALSPDGRYLAFTGSRPESRAQLWIRPLDKMAATQVPGTEGAENPFWSPDGRNIGFFANGKLKKVDISGGSPQVICETEVDVRGGSWGPHDTILYPSTKDVIVSVRESGRPVAVTTLDRSRGEAGHRWPKFLPDGKHFLYTVRSTQEEQSGLYVGSLDGRTKKRLRRSVWSGVYAESGPGLTPFILFVDGSHLLAQRFDLRLLEFQGQPISVAQDLGASSTSYIPVSASDTGVLAYASPFKFTGRLSWYGRSGQQMGSAAPRGDYLDFRISPDDTKVAATLLDAKAMLPKLWLHESARPSAMQRFTFDSVFGASPVWSPDGTRIAFRTWRGTVIEFAENSASGGGRETQVLSEQALRTFGRPEGNAVPSDWSPDGKYLLYHAVAADTGLDLWLLPMVGERKPVRQLGTNFNEMQGAVSPDGRWLAYASDESGRYEIYVQTFPPSTSKVLVSTSGGTEPRWRGDSRELYYLDGARNLMAVPVEPANAFRGGSAQVLFHTNTPAVVGQFRRHYDVTKNGHRFLVNTLVQDPPPPPVITIVVNWASALNP